MLQPRGERPAQRDGGEAVLEREPALLCLCRLLILIFSDIFYILAFSHETKCSERSLQVEHEAKLPP